MSHHWTASFIGAPRPNVPTDAATDPALVGDHRVPPDVPLENYVFYLEKVREIWGHDIHLKPMLHVPKK